MNIVADGRRAEKNMMQTKPTGGEHHNADHADGRSKIDGRGDIESEMAFKT